MLIGVCLLPNGGSIICNHVYVCYIDEGAFMKKMHETYGAKREVKGAHVSTTIESSILLLAEQLVNFATQS